MTSSETSADRLNAYLAGHLSAEQLIATVTADYYRETRHGKRETLRPIMEVIEKAHPGIIELRGRAEKPGFAITVAGRPFPKQFEPELRQVITAVLGTGVVPGAAGTVRPGFFARIFRAIGAMFGK
jgi:hypothetical protein